MIMLHLQLLRRVRGVLLAYMFIQHIKVAHIIARYVVYLNHDEEMIARFPMVDAKLNLC